MQTNNYNSVVSSLPSEAEVFKEEGNAFYIKKDYSEALSRYSKAIGEPITLYWRDLPVGRAVAITAILHHYHAIGKPTAGDGKQLQPLCSRIFYVFFFMRLERSFYSPTVTGQPPPRP